MGYSQIGYLLIGFLGFFVFRLLWLSILRKSPNFKNRFAQTAKTRDLLLFTGNLIVVAGGLSIALYALNITAGGKNMTPAELSELAAYIDKYFALVWILAGLFIGAFVLIIVEMCQDKWRDQNLVYIPPLETGDLVKITKQIKEYRKLKTVLDEFFTKLNNDNDSGDEKEL